MKDVSISRAGEAAQAPKLRKYLDQNVTYDVIWHEPTTTSMRTAEASHVSGECLAKAVVLRRDGGYMLAVLPASHHIRLPDLEMQLGEHVDLAKEGKVDALFQDCAHGAVPPIGVCYELDVIVDDSIAGQPEVYLEGGDHATLIHLSHTQFAQLIADARCRPGFVSLNPGLQIRRCVQASSRL